MQVIENKALLLNVRNPGRITTVIPKSKDMGDGKVLVHWNLEEAQVLKNLKIKDVPSPILGKYDWPGRYKPFDHQKDTASFATLHRRCFILNEQGTGKTGSVIWAADYLMELGRIKRVLIVCPLSIMDSAWRSDLFNFAMHRTVDIAHGARDKRIKIINGDAEFVIINYDGLNIVEEEVKKGGFDLIIVDEANAYKNAQTTRWKTLNRILTPDTWLWMMTGTPAAQSPVDAYGLAKLVNPKGVPQFFTGFKDMVMTKVSTFKWVVRPNADKVVFEALQPAIRYTKEECLDLPEMTYVVRDVELTPQQKKYYEALRKQLVVQTTGEQITAVNAAVGLNKLLQISCIAYNTPVLTDSGWVPIQEVTPKHKVWDGEEWVSQGGVVFRGEKEVAECWGIQMTSDHLVLTTDGWIEAGDILDGESGIKFTRAKVRLPDSYSESGYIQGENKESQMAMCMRLRESGRTGKSVPTHKAQNDAEKLWVPSWKRNPQDEQSPRVFQLSKHVAALPRNLRQRLQKLWSTGDLCLQKVERKFYEFLGRHGADIPTWDDLRSDRQQRPLLAWELSMGYPDSTRTQHTSERPDIYAERQYACSTSSAGIRDQKCHFEKTPEGGLAYRFSTHTTRGREQKTYDLLNCGPRSRFVVKGKEGPLVVHNCGAVYADSGETLHFDISNRYKVLREVIDETNQKILIFVPFKHTISLLKEKLTADGFSTDVISGEVSAGARADIFRRFQSSSDPRILIIQPQAAAHGVTLTAADTIVWWGPTSSLEIYAQANARAHRAGQRHPVTVVKLQGSNAEKHVYRMLDNRITENGKLIDLYKTLLD